MKATPRTIYDASRRASVGPIKKERHHFLKAVLSSVITSTAFLLPGLAQAASPPAPIKVTVKPKQPLIERRDALQLINFDFVLENTGSKPLHLNRIEISIFDSEGKLELRRELDENGHPSGMTTIEMRDLSAGAAIGIFNPFFSFGDEIILAKVSYRFFFNEPNYRTATALDYQYVAEVAVAPQQYIAKTELVLPIRTRTIVFDGHDSYAHHRRLNPADPEVSKFLPYGNADRYAYDLCPVNPNGEMYKDTPYEKKNWYGYGLPVYATGNGRVVAASNDVPDNRYEGKKVVYPDLPQTEKYKRSNGNFVVIDHGNGEYSHFDHMKPESVRVKSGDQLKQGDQIGEIGFSGDAFIPHLHYMLTNAADPFHAESLPSYFHNFRRILGSSARVVSKGQLDSGDIVEPSTN
jgi:Membrane proteins related to metalloendopeptidases